MFIDLLIVAHPLRLMHMFLPVLFGIIFAIFSVIYQTCGGHNRLFSWFIIYGNTFCWILSFTYRKGKPYIYHVIDWREPLNATLVVLGVMLFTCCIYMILFTIYKLRTLLYRRVNNSSYYFPPTTLHTGGPEKSANGTLPKTVKGTGIQHSPSGISMVLGNFNTPTGYHNEAFTSSTEKLERY